MPWVNDEIQSIVNSGLSVRIERNVNERLLVELLSKPIYDIVWFASYGSSDGVFLSDGIVTTDALASILKGAGVHYVVLNTCESVHIAATISEETGADVICTISQVEDKTAWRTATKFANNLAQGLSVYDAFLNARPTQSGKYIYLPGSNGLRNKTELHTQVSALADALLSDQPQKAEQIITNLASMGARVDTLEINASADRKRIDAIERKLSPPPSAILWFLAAMAILLADAFAIFTILNNDELKAIVARIPLIFVFGEVILIALVVTWTRQAVLITRGSEGEQ